MIGIVIQLLIVLSVISFITQSLTVFLGPDGEPGSCPVGTGFWQFGGSHPRPHAHQLQSAGAARAPYASRRLRWCELPDLANARPFPRGR